MRKVLLLALSLTALSWGLLAQDGKLNVNADFLTRGEIRSGGLPLEEEGVQDYAAFILERTMIGVDYSKAGFSTNITAQHSGTWGSSEGGYFNVYEAWIQMTSDKGFFAKIGRQNLSYDDQRIFGPDDWAMTARSHDALKVGYEGNGHKIHLFASYNQNADNMKGGTYYTGGLQSFKAMEALWYHYDIQRANLGISAVFVNIGMQGGTKVVDEKLYQQQVVGTYFSFTPKRFSLEAAYYHQMGKEENGLPINAWMASVKAAWSPEGEVSFYGGYDHLSGDEHFATPPQGQIGMIRHEKIHGFSSINGSHHKFYGAMDFFYVSTYYGGFTPGLQNFYAGMKWKPGKKMTLDAAYHFFATATKLQNADRPLGHEMEFSASYSFGNNSKLSLGYTFMRGTETMAILKRSNDKRNLNWAWLMYTVTPKFFSR